MKINCILCAAVALAMCTATALAGSAKKSEKTEFNRHWFMQLQGGASYTLGEGSFGKLLSPAAALSAGYQFSPVWGLRFGLSGWQAKGAWVSPATVYQYKYMQGSVDAALDLANLFGRFNPLRTVNPYLFAGVGVNGAFDNDEANVLNDNGYALGNIWSDSKVFVVGRLGAGVNFRLSDCVLLGVEVNTNMLSDKYNSKKAGNLDWQFNALAGLTIRFGKNHKKSHPAVAVAAPVQTTPAAEKPRTPAAQEPAVVAPVAAEKSAEAEKSAPLRQDIFFRIGSAQVRDTENTKIAALVEYLKANPEAKVEVIGYADAATGSSAFNLKISRQRAESVVAALETAGIAPDRIRFDGKGDSVQPFLGVEKNRVSICIAK